MASRIDARSGGSADGRGQIRWAAKVKRIQIRRLYELDAKGIVDPDLIDEVAYGFLARCESILTATEASRGQVACPVCGAIIQWEGYDRDRLLVCSACGWETTWGAYRRTYVGKQLHAGGAEDVIRHFVDQLPKARSYRDKMLLIDGLVHECHRSIDARGEISYRRPVAANLIEGTLREVVQLVRGLADGPSSTMGTQAVRARWREHVLASSQNRDRWLSP